MLKKLSVLILILPLLFILSGKVYADEYDCTRTRLPRDCAMALASCNGIVKEVGPETAVACFRGLELAYPYIKLPVPKGISLQLTDDNKAILVTWQAVDEATRYVVHWVANLTGGGVDSVVTSSKFYKIDRFRNQPLKAGETYSVTIFSYAHNLNLNWSNASVVKEITVHLTNKQIESIIRENCEGNPGCISWVKDCISGEKSKGENITEAMIDGCTNLYNPSSSINRLPPAGEPPALAQPAPAQPADGGRSTRLTECNPNGDVDPNTWEYIPGPYGDQHLSCDPHNPGNAGMQWKCQNEIKFTSDIPESGCNQSSGGGQADRGNQDGRQQAQAVPPKITKIIVADNPMTPSGDTAEMIFNLQHLCDKQTPKCNVNTLTAQTPVIVTIQIIFDNNDNNPLRIPLTLKLKPNSKMLCGEGVCGGKNKPCCKGENQCSPEGANAGSLCAKDLICGTAADDTCTQADAAAGRCKVKTACRDPQEIGVPDANGVIRGRCKTYKGESLSGNDGQGLKDGETTCTSGKERVECSCDSQACTAIKTGVCAGFSYDDSAAVGGRCDQTEFLNGHPQRCIRIPTGSPYEGDPNKGEKRFRQCFCYSDGCVWTKDNGSCN